MRFIIACYISRYEYMHTHIGDSALGCVMKTEDAGILRVTLSHSHKVLLTSLL